MLPLGRPSKRSLGCIIDTVAMTITLPNSRLKRLAFLLAEIPRTQKRLSPRQWHKLLGELQSMSLALPGARGLFSHLQAALNQKVKNGRLRLQRGFHDALDDFRWIHADLKSRPTCLYELVPMTSTLFGTQDASVTSARGYGYHTPTPPLEPSHYMYWTLPGNNSAPSCRPHPSRSSGIAASHNKLSPILSASQTCLAPSPTLTWSSPVASFT